MLGADAALAMEMPAGMEQCAAIHADQERLACYDRVVSGTREKQQEQASSALPPQQTADAAPMQHAATNASLLTRHWELDSANKQGIFTFRPHRENYLMGTYNSTPNSAPYRPFRPLNPDAKLSHGELAFQLGFKMKVLENPSNIPLDVWFGYTQRSFWQAGNREASSPFRETNYQPELMAVMPTNLNLLGLRMRFVNLGVDHQSNGQTSTLSRSWNRVYAQAGFERGNFTLLARVWKRLHESANDDDNPDIIRYMGRGDVKAAYQWNGHEFSLLTRYNFQSDKGAAQLGWAFPLVSNLKGYVQYFTGYGYSLIDYDAYQRVLGLGLLVAF
ncbi:phospholipase A [Paucimonas lemoignei]|nr:phospholipase A [Paucimonas lemoignei]